MQVGGRGVVVRCHRRPVQRAPSPVGRSEQQIARPKRRTGEGTRATDGSGKRRRTGLSGLRTATADADGTKLSGADDTTAGRSGDRPLQTAKATQKVIGRPPSSYGGRRAHADAVIRCRPVQRAPSPVGRSEYAIGSGNDARVRAPVPSNGGNDLRCRPVQRAPSPVGRSEYAIGRRNDARVRAPVPRNGGNRQTVCLVKG
jgi:hypothetical protein